MFSLKDSRYRDDFSITVMSSLNLSWCLTLFLLGFLGLNAISLAVSFILLAAHVTENLLGIFLQFFTYLVIFAITTGIILGVPSIRQNLKGHRCDKLGTLVIISLVCYISINLLTNIYSIIVSLAAGIENSNNQDIIEELSGSSPVLMFITVVIMGPLVEEFTYRVGLAGALAKWNKVGAIIISGVFFALIHFSFSKNTDIIVELLNFPIYLIPGLFYGYLYVRTENVWPGIILHVINNLLGFIMIMI